ncbi:MAG: metal-dependent transcriptional regulator [Candidatus Methanomethylophilus sp.]|nr:metal-dependent transcriptional regulator [Methanomethylophilus sp.]
MTTGNREDYLLAILRLTDGGTAAKTTELASFMGVSPASVSEMLKILSKDGLVEHAKYRGVKLTEKGLTEARLTRKRHHVVERFFIEVLGLDHQSAHEEAHRIEHSISDEASVKMCNMLGNPPDCDCQCCITPCKSVASNGISINTLLSDMSEGEKGVISFLKSEDNASLRNLVSMGFAPGKVVTVDSKNKDTGVMIVIAEGTSVAIDDRLSTKVYVDALAS